MCKKNVKPPNNSLPKPTWQLTWTTFCYRKKIGRLTNTCILCLCTYGNILRKWFYKICIDIVEKLMKVCMVY